MLNHVHIGSLLYKRWKSRKVRMYMKYEVAIGGNIGVSHRDVGGKLLETMVEENGWSHCITARRRYLSSSRWFALFRLFTTLGMCANLRKFRLFFRHSFPLFLGWFHDQHLENIVITMR